jgi:phospholipase/carboxylesterase
MKIRTISEIRDPQAPTVVLFHGYGADASDLAPLADAIPTQKTFNYVFPEGPLSIPLGPHWVGRAWWPINMERLQSPQGDYDISSERPQELEITRRQVHQMISDLKVSSERLIIGGFSQGGMCAVDQFLMTDLQPKALILLSSALINRDEWRTGAQKKGAIPYFLSHGQRDPVLKLRDSDRLHSFLSEMKCKGQRTIFNGVHEIPFEVLQKLGAWLDQVVTSESLINS